jgi:hypothetical protein
MLKDDNLHEVKTELSKYDELFLHYQTTQQLYHDALLSEDDQDKETQRYYDHENSIRDFRGQTAKWILDAEHRISNTMDSLSEHRRTYAGSRHSSRTRHSGSIYTTKHSSQSARIARLAALLVQI